jgi:hypothetical protein
VIRLTAEDYATRFPSYGMTDMKFTAEHPHTWGWILTTADDLDRLMNYVLNKLPTSHREYIVREMRIVDPTQRWGVWGAGNAVSPGDRATSAEWPAVVLAGEDLRAGGGGVTDGACTASGWAGN